MVLEKGLPLKALVLAHEASRRDASCLFLIDSIDGYILLGFVFVFVFVLSCLCLWFVLWFCLCLCFWFCLGFLCWLWFCLRG